MTGTREPRWLVAKEFVLKKLDEIPDESFANLLREIVDWHVVDWSEVADLMEQLMPEVELPED